MGGPKFTEQVAVPSDIAVIFNRGYREAAHDPIEIDHEAYACDSLLKGGGRTQHQHRGRCL